jgi:hypothetical protein
VRPRTTGRASNKESDAWQHSVKPYVFCFSGQERTFTNALVDRDTEGWLHITRLEVQEGPISGVADPIAGYRLEVLKGWEYVE